MSFTLHGIKVSRGITIGRAMLIASARINVAHYYVEPGREEAEVERLRAARLQVLKEMEAVKDGLSDDAPQEVAALIDVHMMLLVDPSLRADTGRWIRERRYNAEWAVTAQLDVLSRQFDEMQDDYLRERKLDLEQVVERLLHALHGTVPMSQTQAIRMKDGQREGLVLVAHDIAPADMMQFKTGLFAGFVTDTGGTTSHTAIVARSLDIPAVVALREATRLIKQDDLLIVDADEGVLIVDPTPQMLQSYAAKQAANLQKRAALEKLRPLKARTADGVDVQLQANIELPEDAIAAYDSGADGIGLFRSEFLFMNRSALPGEEEQYEAYCFAVRAMCGKPVTIRTIDIGADKPLDSAAENKFEQEGYHTASNPALGLRAIRYSLAQPLMFLTQLRALLRASVHGPVKILIPMIAHVREVEQSFKLIAQAREQLGMSAGPHVAIGAMIEIPAAALMLPYFVSKFDFLSIGTNDLVQYTLAIDRADESVASLYDPTHPAVLRLIQDTIDAGHAAGKPVSMCGEMAGEVRFTKLLLGMGLTDFSMHPSEILDVKRLLVDANRSVLAKQARGYLAAFEEAERERLFAQCFMPH